MAAETSALLSLVTVVCMLGTCVFLLLGILRRRN